MFCNLDTKGSSKKYFHPYNTRSRRRTVVTAEAGPANVIPSTLYNAIQAALGAWKDWEAKQSKEHVVEGLTTYYKQEKLLPASWTCEPALVPSNKDNRPLGGVYLGPPIVCEHESESESDSDSDPDSDYFRPHMLHRIKDRPPTNCVPLEKNQTETWMQFRKLVESNRARVKVNPDRTHAVIPVDIRHPIVELIGNFAVMGFNKSYEKYIEQGKCSQLHDSVLRKFAYLKLRDIRCHDKNGRLCKVGGSYLFYMLIEAIEDGLRGIYRAKVKSTCDGVKTLLSFSYVDRTIVEKKLRKRKNKGFKVLGAVELLKNNRGFNLLRDEVYTCNGGMKMAFSSTNEVYIPWHSGMKRRMGSRSGYDFFNASEQKLRKREQWDSKCWELWNF